jgi:hypothetical protein
MEANYWHDTKKARDREDARLAHEHSSRQELLDQGLTELYNKKLDLQKAMNEVNTNIESQMAEKQRLSHEYETRMAILLSERQDEDRSQHGWFARIREGSLPDKENTIPKDNNESNALNHEPTPPNPVGSWTSINGTLRRSSRVQEQRRDPGNLFGSVFHNPVEETAIPNSHAVPLQDSSTQLQPDRDYGAPTETSIGAPEGNTAGYIRDGAVKPKPERHSLPAFPTGNGK